MQGVTRYHPGPSRSFHSCGEMHTGSPQHPPGGHVSGVLVRPPTYAQLSICNCLYNHSHKNDYYVLRWLLLARLQEDWFGSNVQDRLERGTGRKLEHAGKVNTIMWNNSSIAFPPPLPHIMPGQMPVSEQPWEVIIFVLRKRNQRSRQIRWLLLGHTAHKKGGQVWTVTLCLQNLLLLIFSGSPLPLSEPGRGRSWRMRTKRIERKDFLSV